MRLVVGRGGIAFRAVLKRTDGCRVAAGHGLCRGAYVCSLAVPSHDNSFLDTKEVKFIPSRGCCDEISSEGLLSIVDHGRPILIVSTPAPPSLVLVFRHFVDSQESHALIFECRVRRGFYSISLEVIKR